MYKKHQEGQISFLCPPLPKVPTTDMPVFYNPRSELNRDITIAGIQVFLNQNDITAARICTPLAGTGVRAIRLAKEVQGIKHIVAGDANPLAVELIQKNCELNRVSHVITVHHREANQLLSEYNRGSQKFDIIDIDPFGSPRNFFSAAVKALRPMSLLCVTATDMPVLVGIRRRACIKRYAAEPAKTEYSHELAIRILLGSIVREAAANDLGLQPLLTFYVDHYVRLLCEAKKGDEATWNAVSQIGYLLHCEECGHRQITTGIIPIPKVCQRCKGSNIQRAGPLWTGRLADKDFIIQTLEQIQQRPLGTQRRSSRLLKRLGEELDGPPTYHDLHKLADKLGISIPSFNRVINELQRREFFASRSHFSPHAIRTSASEETLGQILHAFAGDE